MSLALTYLFSISKGLRTNVKTSSDAGQIVPSETKCPVRGTERALPVATIWLALSKSVKCMVFYRCLHLSKENLLFAVVSVVHHRRTGEASTNRLSPKSSNASQRRPYWLARSGRAYVQSSILLHLRIEERREVSPHDGEHPSHREFGTLLCRSFYPANRPVFYPLAGDTC
ncbi:hypothetical protein bAD24_III12020 [Burkholderia sp. AD24]|nr:hypothetical protein bAD24_III12020 [Burkholderia sp. AD24]